MLAIAAIIILVVGFLKRLKVYKQGQALDRTDNIGSRMSDMVKNVMLQKKVTRFVWPGLFHGLSMFEDGVKGADIEESLRPRDIAEVLADRL